VLLLLSLLLLFLFLPDSWLFYFICLIHTVYIIYHFNKICNFLTTMSIEILERWPESY
jgi:hypothetical protein